MRRVLWALVVLALPATRAQEQQAASTTVTAAAPTTDTLPYTQNLTGRVANVAENVAENVKKKELKKCIST